MDNKPQVAVMLPVFNAEDTLSLAISSLIHQTYPYWKCYVVNDGSTDGTKQMLNHIEDARFVITHLKENGGRPFARQAALEMAEGKYMAMLDADDFYHPDKLQIQVQYLENHSDVALLSCGMGSFKTVKEGIKRVRGNESSEPVLFKIGDKLQSPQASSMLILDTAQKTGYDLRLKYGQDMDFLSRYLHNKKYTSIGSVLYFYSEFESVSDKKLLKTRWYNLLSYLALFPNAPIKISFSILNSLIKWFLTLLTLPFVGTEYFVEHRGKAVKPKMNTEFQNILNELNKKVLMHNLDN
jgi:glycosyltransferase involved in cell wall biosynthesis